MSSISALNFNTPYSQIQLKALVQSLPPEAPQKSAGAGEDLPFNPTSGNVARAILADVYKLQTLGAEGVKSLTVAQYTPGPGGGHSVGSVTVGGHDPGMTKAQVKAKWGGSKVQAEVNSGPSKIQAEVKSAPSKLAASVSIASKPKSFGKPDEKTPVVKAAVGPSVRRVGEGGK